MFKKFYILHKTPLFCCICWLHQEAMFEHKVRQNVYEERQNQLRWQVKLGDDQITNSDRAQILEDRDQSWKEYKVRIQSSLVVYRDIKLQGTGMAIFNRGLHNLLYSYLWYLKTLILLCACVDIKILSVEPGYLSSLRCIYLYIYINQ